MRSSVIIPNYNYENFIGQAIDSVLKQSLPFDEIIVVDDGSQDRSRDVIAGYGDRIVAIYQENSGQAAAISRGYAESSGDIILLLDSDDMFAHDKNKQLCELYEANPEIGWIFHDLAELPAEECASYALQPQSVPNTAIQNLDQRQAMIKGKPSYQSPATSGLSFRRETIEPIFPLPKAKSIYISDHYIKFFCLATSAGIHIHAPLAAQAVHDNNLYTGKKNSVTKARIFINTALELRKAAPHIPQFCNNIFAVGNALARKYAVRDELRERIEDYVAQLSAFEKIFIRLKIAYQYMRV
jgi:glycosyltransferase involved in cell wall biosynthesis